MSKATNVSDAEVRQEELDLEIDSARHEFTLDGLVVANAVGVLCDTCGNVFEAGVHYTTMRRTALRAQRLDLDEETLEHAEALTTEIEEIAEAEETDREDATPEETRHARAAGEWTYLRKTVEICNAHNLFNCRECRFAQLRWRQIQQQRRARRQWMKKPEVPFFRRETASFEFNGDISRPIEPWAYRNPVSVAKAAAEREEDRQSITLFRHDPRACAPVTQAIRAYLNRLAPTYVEGGTRPVFETRPSNARWQGYRPRILAS